MYYVEYLYYFQFPEKQNINICYRYLNIVNLWLLIINEIIVYGWQKILENITRGSGHHLWKYWTYHSWPSATRDKSNIFTRDDQNHS